MSTANNKKIGHLDATPSRTDGKLIDEWTFSAAKPASKSAEKISIAVKVSLVAIDNKLCFRAKIPNLVNIENSDIQTLREKVEEALILHSAARLGNAWEDWLRVTVANDDWRERDNTMSSALSIVVEPVKRGVDPETGKVYLLSGHGLWAVPLNGRTERAKLAEQMESLENSSGIRMEEKTEVSYVPATPENIAALKDVSARMVQLRQRLVRAFLQDNILKTLGSLNTVLALAAPEDCDASQAEGTQPKCAGPR